MAAIITVLVVTIIIGIYTNRDSDRNGRSRLVGKKTVEAETIETTAAIDTTA